MNFELSDEQRLLRDTVRDFARNEVAQAHEATGWDLRVADRVEHTEPVTQHELDELRELRASAGR